MVSERAQQGDETSLYRYYDTDDILIYVGITSRGIARNVEHNRSKVWWQHVARQEVEHHPSRSAALAAEADLIKRHRPPFNTQHNPDSSRARESYEALISASRADLDPSTKRQLRRRLPLTALLQPIGGHLVTLHSHPDHFDAIRGAGIIGLVEHENIRVSAPGRLNAGRVCDMRMVGQMLVLGIRGKYLPDEVTSASAQIKVVQQRKPVSARIVRVYLNEGAV